jgi:hypothetical protein
VHHGRFGGNARKRKTRLTDSTFNTMIGVPTVERPECEDEADHAQPDEGSDEEAFVRPATLFKVAIAPVRPIKRRLFQPQEYVFGYTSCKNCHSDQAFYIHRVDLDAGYMFRCRVCRMEITVTPESLTQS